MNSSNDPLDKRLRQRFQQLFAGELAEVDDALKQRIWHQLPRPTPRRDWPVGFLLLGLLFCASIAVYYGAASGVGVSKRTSSSLHPSAGPPTASHAQIIRTKPPKPSSPLMTSMSAHPPEVIAHSYPKHGRYSVGPPGDFPSNLVLREVPGSVLVSSMTVRGRQGRRPSGFRSTEPMRGTDLPISQVIANRNQHRVLVLSVAGITEFVGSSAKSTHGNDSLTHETLTNNLPFLLAPLGAVGSISSTLSARLNRCMDFPPPVEVAAKTNSSQPFTPVDWFFTAAPFSTYQRMTIVASTDTYVQAVTSPAPWSALTWGYQLGGGVRWSGWEVGLSYGQLRRWAYYERATDSYQVEPSGPSAYQVRRRSEAVAENVSLSLVGVGLTRSYEWGKQGRYFARTGGQLTYVLPTHQALGWLELSWGLVLPLGKRHQFEVGPRLAYSLSDVWSTDRQLRIQPYTAGLSLRIRH